MIYGGVKYRDTSRPLPGTGARRRLYFDWFYCEHGCGRIDYNRLEFQNTTYDSVEFNATSIPSKDVELIIAMTGDYFR